MDETKNAELIDQLVNDNLDEETPAAVKTEAKKEVVFAGYQMDQLEAYIKEIDQLTSLECASNLKSLEAQKNQMTALHEMMQSFKDWEKDEEDPEKQLPIQIDKANMDFMNDPEVIDFEEKYDENIAVVDKLMEHLKARVAAANAQKSGKLFNDEMIHILHKRLDKLNINAPNFQYDKDKLKRTIEGFERRTSLNYVMGRMYTVFQGNKKTLRALRKVVEDKNAFNACTKGLRKSFTKEQLMVSMHTLSVVFKPKAALTVLAVLSRINASEVRTGFNVWSKAVILNLNDIAGGIFDLGSANEYMTKLWRTFALFIHTLFPKDYPTEEAMLVDGIKWTHSHIDAFEKPVEDPAPAMEVTDNGRDAIDREVNESGIDTDAQDEMGCSNQPETV